ncbi:MAG: serine/threonine-protein kinase [Labilithrix sp.]
MVAASTLQTAPVKEGEVLAAKYRVEKVIGVGGMGVVVSAMHLELEKRVALKFLLPQAQESDELIGRFMREARSSVKLKGEHVARTLDVGRMDDGRAYIVMEYLEGNDLGQEIKASTEPFPIEEGVSWILQACEGLAEAHALGIVHRDLKPANLFLQHEPGDRRFVKVLDFGISKSINPSSSDHLSLTKTEMLLGSPLYMAPEQMRSSKYVDERSDIWSLGAVAYEVLSGHVPFEAETLLDLCFRVAQEDCVPPTVHRPEIPAGLSDAVMRCLEKEPSKRWNNVGELAAALEPFGPADKKGTAARTAGILAAGDPKARPRGEVYVPQTVDRSRTTVSKAITRSGTRTVVQPDEQVITGSAATERAPGLEDDEPIPPSRALNPMPPPSEPAPSSPLRTPLLIAALGVSVLVISYLLTRSTHTPAPLPPATPEVLQPPAPPPAPAPVPAPVPPPPAEPAVAAPAAAASSATPPGPGPAPAPRPRPKPSATPAPADSGGFLKVRE